MLVISAVDLFLTAFCKRDHAIANEDVTKLSKFTCKLKERLFGFTTNCYFF